MSRRSMLGTVGAASLAPVLLKAGAPAAQVTDPELRPAFSGTLIVGAPQRVEARLHSATITGGSLDGSRLTGAVQGGRIQWLAREDGGHEMSLHFEVRCRDGRLVEVSERAILAAGIDPASRCAVTATIEPISIEARAGEAALLAGRLDATEIERGEVKLLAFEVA